MEHPLNANHRAIETEKDAIPVDRIIAPLLLETLQNYEIQSSKEAKLQHSAKQHLEKEFLPTSASTSSDREKEKPAFLDALKLILRSNMITESKSVAGSKLMFWAGWIISALPILMMGIAPIFFLSLKPQMMTDGMQKYGYPPADVKAIVAVEICCGLIYAIPQTAVLGAILITGYLGGATATHVRVGELPIAPILFGVLVWLGLYLRDARLRALLPWRAGVRSGETHFPNPTG